MTGQNSFWFANPSTGFYNGVINQSLRFEDGNSSHLSRTPSSAGDRKTFTISFWMKRANLSTPTPFLFDAYNASTENSFLRFNTDDTLRFSNEIGSSFTSTIVTNQVFRDTANWYHIVLAVDTTQSTASNRVKMYVNGEQITSFSSSDYPSQNENTSFNNTVGHYIGRAYEYSRYFDGYMAEVNFVDGSALTPSSFGETKNDVWIAKEYTGSYGTNGYRLTFADSSSLGDDTSGNGNDYSSSGFASSYVVLDSPENNFATLNFLAGSTQQAASLGNLRTTASSSGANFASNRSTIGVKSGKWYAEFRLDVVQLGTGGQDNGVFVGTGSKEYPHDSSNQNGTDNGVAILYTANSTSSNRGIYVNGTLFDSGLDAHAAGDIIGIEMNVDDSEVTFYKNGTKQGNTRGIGASIDGGFYYFYTYVRDQTANTQVTANFGQDSTFVGQESAGSNTDANGIGLFKYAPSSGYLALCSSNLPDTTLSPNQAEQATDYFNTVLWTGTGNTTQDITGVGFQPDWVWIKNRNTAVNHYLLDSSRGLNDLHSNTDTAESSSANRFNSFDSDGFQVEHSGGGNGFTNGASQTYVAWNWKANGGTTSSNSDGSITSTVQASTDAGFSIVLWNGEGDSQATVGHGLGAVPKVIIPKNRDTTGNWHMYHAGVDASAPEDYGLLLNANNARSDDSGFHNDTAPTSSVFTVGTYNNFNNDYVAYCFAEIEGYSKIDSYIGNGSTDGTFVYTGFRPAWIMFKRTASADSWIIHDNKRDPHNLASNNLFPNGNFAEDSNTSNRATDFLSNGFKLRASAQFQNQNGERFVYMAFAEQPFKFSNAR